MRRAWFSRAVWLMWSRWVPTTRTSSPEPLITRRTQFARRTLFESHDLEPGTWGVSDSQYPPAETSASPSLRQKMASCGLWPVGWSTMANAA